MVEMYLDFSLNSITGRWKIVRQCFQILRENYFYVYSIPSETIIKFADRIKTFLDR